MARTHEKFQWTEVSSLPPGHTLANAAQDSTVDPMIAPIGSQRMRFFSFRGSATITTKASIGSPGMASSQFESSQAIR